MERSWGQMYASVIFNMGFHFIYSLFNAFAIIIFRTQNNFDFFACKQYLESYDLHVSDEGR